MNRTKRTGIDWSKHMVETVETDNFRMDWIHIPGTVNRNVRFINTNGIMAVTGDYGNWIFCREFHPSSKGYVSGGYWDEKLSIASKQESSKFCSDSTEEDILEFRKRLEEEYEEGIPENIEDWLQSLKNSVDDYWEYIYVAYRETPEGIDYEQVPFSKKRYVWLDAVYDAFDELCRRLEEKEL